MEIEALIRQYDFNLRYAKALVADISEEEMIRIPAKGLVNHGAFTLGHLISGSALMVRNLGGEFELPKGWKDLFLRRGPGDPRVPDPHAEKYPDKETLINALESKHEEVKSLLRQLEKEKLAEDFNWRFSTYMPQLYDLCLFMCVNHEAMHLGQLAAWRRALDKPSALATL